MPPSKVTPGPRRSPEDYMQLVNELITEGKAIQKDVEKRVVDDDITGDAAELGYSMLREEKVVDRGRFISWQNRWATLLLEIVPQAHPQRRRFDDLSDTCGDPSTLEEMLALLDGVRQDLDKGLLGVSAVPPQGASVSATFFDSLADTELKQRCSDILKAPAHFDRVVNQATLVLEDRIRKRGSEQGLDWHWLG